MATAPPHIHPTPEVMTLPSFLVPHLTETRQVLIFVFIVVPAFCLLYYSLGDSDSKNGTAGSGKGKPVVALAGAPDAGKTTIFSALAFQQQPQTHTSLTSSSSIITVPSSTSSGDMALTLVDLPGHRRMREQTQRALRDPKFKGVVFVVDVAALIRNGAMVAEELVPILTTLCAKSLSNQTQTPPKLLIMGNKSDLLVKPTSTQPGTTTTATPKGTLDVKTRALARERLESLLTRELSRAKSSRASRTGRIESIDAVPSSNSSFSLLGYLKRLFRLDPGVTPGAGVVGEKEEEWKVEQAEDAMWGERNGTFRFEEVEGVDIEFAVGSAVGRGADGKRSEEDGLGELRDWLSEL
ncbi:hypothetical protein QFC22_004591 [Naganishia vaughanmartiniae]|uniref:Uncharacterized protein n=1 Tax=Naganishia vaughanmartiniae TaxID=1424756 RepID=A0ACC2WYU2_9TREE|nr:hypothetical protein QFC22_004591 [Naganishia vaughanmartiniae]